MLIENIPPFELNWDAGDMMMYALESCLFKLGQKRKYWWLAGISGDAFKFVYDKGDVREPMRDRNPIDIVKTAYNALGFEGRWIIDKNKKEVISLVKNSLNKGYPIITTFLGKKWYHGACIIVGIDENEEDFYLQIAREDLEKNEHYERLAIPQNWDGTVPGPVVWGDNPLFIVKDKKTPPRSDENLLKNSVENAISLYHGKPLPYKAHPGAQKYSTPSLKSRKLPQGKKAFKEILNEISASEITWPVIWSLTTQCGQLKYDRSNAAKFFEYMSQKEFGSPLFHEISNKYAEIAKLSENIRDSFWDSSLYKIKSIKEIQQSLENSHSFIYSISIQDQELLNQIKNSFSVLETPWGKAILVDDKKRRQKNILLMKRILKHEKQIISRLKKVHI